jgi:ERCC4-type nuclease
MEHLVVFAVGTIWVLAYLSNLYVEWRSGPDPDTPEGIRLAYERGEIDHAELERRLDVVMDPEADRIREAVERVSGIGEATSWNIAAEFDSLRELREADREEIQRVPNIGEERAAALEDI